MISFAIPAKNEEKNLPHTLKHIHTSAKKLGLKYEIVVCDNNSTDKTTYVATKLGAKVVHLQEPSISKAKNTAAEACKGEIMIFMDADTTINEQLLQKAIEKLKKPKIQGVSCLTSLKKYPTFASRGVWLYNIFSYFFKLGAGHFMAIKTTSFKQVNGFDSNVYAYEDIELFKRLKKKNGFRSISILRDSIKTSARKFEAGYDVKPFLLGLIGASLGFKVGRDKQKLDFWYGKPQKHSRRYFINKILALTVFILLTIDIFGLNGNLKNDVIAQNIAILLIFGLSTLIIIKTPLEFIFLPVLFFIEYVGITFSIPFGRYFYNTDYWAIAGIPIFIPLAWYLVVKSAQIGLRNIFATGLFVVAFDLVLEEFATNKQIWTWGEHTDKLTAPYQNYISWYFIALITAYAIKKLKFDNKVDRYHGVLNFVVIGIYISLLAGGPLYVFGGIILITGYGLISLIISASKV